MLRRIIPLLFLMLAMGAQAAPKTKTPLFPAAPFFLHDGDRVVFYGDSITEQRLYGEFIETYVLTRYPKMHVQFINSGWGGDRVIGGGGGPIDVRLKRDVINYKPTVVTVFLGMNDGLYHPYDEATFQTYAQGLTHIVDTLTAALPGVRLTLITPSFFDKDKFQANHDLDYNATLLKYGDFVKAMGRHGNIPVVDVNAPMVDATTEGRKTDPHFTLTFDGIHPNPVGHLIIASDVLQKWHALSAGKDIALKPNLPITLGLPLSWPVPPEVMAATFHISPLPSAMNMFHVHNLHKAGKASASHSAFYALTIDGQAIVSYGSPSANWTAGFTLPQNAQAQKVLALVQQRSDMWHEFWMDSKVGVAHATDIPTDDELATLRAENTRLDTLREQARAAAQPVPHTFALTPITKPGIKRGNDAPYKSPQ